MENYSKMTIKSGKVTSIYPSSPSSQFNTFNECSIPKSVLNASCTTFIKLLLKATFAVFVFIAMAYLLQTYPYNRSFMKIYDQESMTYNTSITSIAVTQSEDAIQIMNMSDLSFDIC